MSNDKGDVGMTHHEFIFWLTGFLEGIVEIEDFHRDKILERIKEIQEPIVPNAKVVSKLEPQSIDFKPMIEKMLKEMEVERKQNMLHPITESYGGMVGHPDYLPKTRKSHMRGREKEGVEEAEKKMSNYRKGSI